MPAVIVPAAIAVGGWLGAGAAAVAGTVAAAGTAVAIGTAVTALTTAALTQAAYGAIIGAATTAIRGGDILEGALNGAKIGAVTGGIMSAGSATLAKMLPGSKLGQGFGAQVDTGRIFAGGGAAGEPTTVEADVGQGMQSFDTAPAGVPTTTPTPPTPGILERVKSGLTSEKAIAGAVQGGATALLGGMAQSRAEKEAEEREQRRLDRFGIRTTQRPRFGTTTMGPKRGILEGAR